MSGGATSGELAKSVTRRAFGALLVCFTLLVTSPSALAATGTISGTVTNASTSAAISGENVTVFDSSDNFMASAITDSSGNYTVSGLAAGTYEVEFSGGNYITQFYNGKASLSSADPVSVTEGSTSSGINAALQPGGQITGRVTDALSSAAIQNVLVGVFDSSGSFVNSACTASDGTYTVSGLATGSYHVGFDASGSFGFCGGSSQNYLPQFYNGKASLSSADPVSVTAGSTSSGINAALQPGGQITGKVTDASSSAAIQNVQVDVFDSSGNVVNSACTASDGTYTVSGLATGSYHVGFDASGSFGFCGGSSQNYLPQFYNGKASLSSADPVSVTAGSTSSGINAALQPGGQITGKVTDASSSAAIQNVQVDVFDSSGNVVNSACTASDGTYTVSGLATGSYHVGFDASGSFGFCGGSSQNYLPQFYNGKASLSSADPVSVTAGSTSSGINAALQPPGQITGKVTDASSSAAIQNVQVDVFDSSGNVVNSACTASDGTYTVSGLATGSYHVGFDASGSFGFCGGSSQNYLPQFYNGKASLSSADPVSVTAGSTSSGINAALQPPGQITGNVTNASSSAAIAGGSVTVFDSSDNFVAFASTDSNGNYTVSGLKTGTYEVEFSGGNYITQFYNGKASLSSADPVSVTAGSTSSGINAALQPTGQITGRVTNASTGAAIQNVLVNVYGSSGNVVNSACTASDGTYTVSGLATGSYHVGFDASGSFGFCGGSPRNYLPQFYNGKASLSSADPVSVTAGSTSSGINAALQPGGQIAGNVTNASSSAAIAGGSVTVFDSSDNFVAFASTDSNGNYTVSGLKTGTYEVEFSGGNYITQFYNGKASLSSADPVSVTAGSTSSGINAALQPTGQITGRVTNASTGAAIQGDSVNVFAGGGRSPAGFARTDASGNYTVSGLTTGTYEVEFYGGNYITQFYNGKASLSSADPVSVTAGSTTSGINAAVSAPPLKADAGENVDATTGVAVTLDGSGSTPAGGISAYHWDFGDGSSADGPIVNHAYTAPGTYTATLTVTGASGQSSATTTVVVSSPQPQAPSVTVVDANGQPIAGADVMYVSPSGAKTAATSDSRGVVQLPGLPDGQDTVYAYKSGYQPTPAQLDVSAGTGHATVTLQSGAVATVKLQSQQLTLQQIQAAGIDTSDPANQLVFNFDVKLAFGDSSVTLNCNINSAGQFVGSNCSGGGGCVVSAGGCQGPGISATGEMINGHPAIQWLILRGNAAILKQFFEVSMVVTNLSPEPFDLTGGQATLNLPAGMSLAPTATPQSLTQTVPTIGGSSSAETDWVIRGDVPGSYNLSAEYDGTLQPFGDPVSITAGVAQPLKVWGADALGLSVQADSGSFTAGSPYHVRIAVTNNADVPLYNVNLSIDSRTHTNFIFQPDERFNDQIGELDPGQTLYSHTYILIPDTTSGSVFDPSLSSATFAGQMLVPGQGISTMTPPTLYPATAPADTVGMVHLHWPAVPGAQGYLVFSTPNLDTPFAVTADAAATTATGSPSTSPLPSTATDAYLTPTDDSARYYAVSAIINGQPTLESPLVLAAATRSGKIVVKKVTDPSPDPTVTQFTFNPTGYGNASFKLGDGQSNDSGSLAPGSGYKVTESPTAGWTLTSASCDNGNDPTSGITVSAGQTVTCTFKNQAQAQAQGKIVVKKVTDPSPDPTVTQFTFNPTGYGNASFKLGDGQSNDSGSLAPGSGYKVTESPTAGWTLTSASCDNGNDPTSGITVSAGQTVTCTFKNQAQAQAQGKIVVKKVTDPSPDPTVTQFTFNPTGYGNASFKLGDGQSNDSGSLAPGSGYKVTESPTAGWTLTSASCDNGNDPTSGITVSAGQTVTCTFKNQAQGKGKIVFVSTAGGGSHIYVMNADGSNVHAVTSGKALDTTPAFSRDGSQIAFASSRTGNGDIYVMNADGTSLRRLTTSTAIELDPSWSPDGRQVVFVSTAGGGSHIYVMNADGSNVHAVTSGKALDTTPAFSRDGSQIAFASSRTGNGDIYVMNADGTSLRRLTTSTAIELDPSWSPDGRQVVFVSTAGGGSHIYVMNADGSNVHAVTSGKALDTTPAFSRDGSQIAFASSRTGNGDIYVMNADGTSLRRLTTSTAVELDPSWSP